MVFKINANTNLKLNYNGLNGFIRNFFKQMDNDEIDEYERFQFILEVFKKYFILIPRKKYRKKN